MNKTDLANKTDFTRRGIQKMAAKGFTEEDIVAKAAGPRKRKPKKATEEPEPNPESLTFAEAQRLKEIYLAKNHKLKYEEDSGQLVRKEEVNQYFAGMIVRSRDIFLRIGTELQDKLAQESDPAKVRIIIDAEVDRALRELSTYKPE